jgi:hypothetical protein
MNRTVPLYGVVDPLVGLAPYLYLTYTSCIQRNNLRFDFHQQNQWVDLVYANPATPTTQKQRLSTAALAENTATAPDIAPETSSRAANNVSGQILDRARPPGGPVFVVAGTIASDDDLTTARQLYHATAADNPDRVVLLCDRSRILARSDRRDAMP